MDQLIQIGGALLILAAFTAAQAGRVNPRSRVYLLLNLAGSAVLAYDALHGRDWGFLLLEASWAIVSAWGLLLLVRVQRRVQPDPAAAARQRLDRPAL